MPRAFGGVRGGQKGNKPNPRAFASGKCALSGLHAVWQGCVFARAEADAWPTE
jgi:hypothetical protein